MATETAPTPKIRTPLSRVRVLDAAVALADEKGFEALTMRNLADALDVEAMSLYYHVANKEALLDGVVDVIAGEILKATRALDGAEPENDWKAALREWILAARQVMLRHKWAARVFETRTTMSPTLLHYYDGILAMWLRAGFSYDLAHHAMHALGSRALGFTQELFDPAPGSDDAEVNDEMFEQMASELPHLVGMLAEISHDDPESTIGWCDDQTEFEFGLDILLDGLEKRLQAERGSNNLR